MNRPDGSTPGVLGGFSDLVVVVLATAALLLGGSVLTGPPRIVLGFVFVFFLPGYALTAALYPAVEQDRQSTFTQRLRTAPTATEWLVYAVGLSIVVTPLAVLVVNFLPVPIVESTALGAVSAVTVAGALVAIVRRARVPPDRRTFVPYGRVTERLGADLQGTPPVAAVVVACCLVAAGVAGATLATQPPGERYTEFYLLTEADEQPGTFVADDYPSELGPDGQVRLHVGLTNQEHETVTYTVVVEANSVVRRNESTAVAVATGNEVDRFQTTVPHNETWRREHVVSPEVRSENVRLTYLLYRGEPPENPTMDNAYRSVHIWLDTTE